MSTCQHQNYGNFKPGIKVNIGTSKDPINIMYISSPPHNCVTGDIYFDTNLQTLRMYNGNKWIDIDSKQLDQKFIDEFDIIGAKIGFVKVKLYQELNGKRGIILENDDGILIDDTESALTFIKENIPDSYLWVEKRLLEHLA